MEQFFLSLYVYVYQLLLTGIEASLELSEELIPYDSLDLYQTKDWWLPDISIIILDDLKGKVKQYG